MRRRDGYGIAAGLIVIGLAATLAAQPPAGGQGMRGQGMGQGMRGQGPDGGPMAALNLTAEQRQNLQALMQTEREARQATMAQVRDLRKQLQQALYGGEKPDQAAASKLASEIAAIEADARVRTLAAAADILTPEQKKILLESGMEFPQGPMGPGGPGGRGGRGGQPPVKK
jgi:Spy/CpxP family protein refolding chaperone